MKNQSKKQKSAPAVFMPSGNETRPFDELFYRDEEEVSRQQKYHLNRNGKKTQLLAKISDIAMRLNKAETRYQESLLDPTADSVTLYIEIDVMKKEIEITKRIHNDLFPETAV